MTYLCPACNTALQASDQCCPDPECALTFQILDDYYSKSESKDTLINGLNRLSDKCGSLNSQEASKIAQKLDQFSKTFPGLYFAIVIEAVGAEPDSKALWLLNKVNFRDLPKKTHQQYGLLLYLDPKSDQCALSYGYGIAPYFQNNEGLDFMMSASPLLRDGQYYEALVNVLAQVTTHLTTSCPKEGRSDAFGLFFKSLFRKKTSPPTKRSKARKPDAILAPSPGAPQAQNAPRKPRP